MQEGINILAVNYGAPGACSYPRQLKLPAKWSFNSHTVLKNTELAPSCVQCLFDCVISKAAYQVTSHYFFIEYADCVPRAVDELVRGTISQLADPGSTLHSNKTCNLNDTCGERLLPVYEICRGVKVRTPIFAEDILGGDTAEGEDLKPPERSFWAKYWMYLIPVGMIVLNAITQAMNMAEEPAGGQPQQSGAAVQRGTTAPVRRR
ncbi:hypothetical protein CJ030_MR4G026757 [Morella rubra]|uniref:ER membrane protein complex subunit 10 n=1 Tax=Morella rubra TaxID=262757 RepID=A0A6A1VU95_9ROSI|nr:hypothetical protein CJ030_MR4G026757 [Morella rubra]